MRKDLPRANSSRCSRPFGPHSWLRLRTTPSFGEHALNLGLGSGPQRHQLRPTADDLPELTRRRRENPRLRDHVEPMHVHQGVGVTNVVLDAAEVPVQTERMGQVDFAPISAMTSVAQYQPQVASRTTSGSPADATTLARVAG